MYASSKERWFLQYWHMSGLPSSRIVNLCPSEPFLSCISICLLSRNNFQRLIASFEASNWPGQLKLRQWVILAYLWAITPIPILTMVLKFKALCFLVGHIDISAKWVVLWSPKTMRNIWQLLFQIFYRYTN